PRISSHRVPTPCRACPVGQGRRAEKLADNQSGGSGALSGLDLQLVRRRAMQVGSTRPTGGATALVKFWVGRKACSPSHFIAPRPDALTRPNLKYWPKGSIHLEGNTVTKARSGSTPRDLAQLPEKRG